MSSVPISLVAEGSRCSRAARVSALQDVLRARFPAAVEIAPRPDGVLRTGVEALDRLLLRGGRQPPHFSGSWLPARLKQNDQV